MFRYTLYFNGTHITVIADDWSIDGKDISFYNESGKEIVNVHVGFFNALIRRKNNE